ncbi:Peptidase M23 [Caenorhabditis elegans]|uniref:Peptidase M23 n=1 Tax=Caenorhabditis elegans TaxID=6239 RepID=Q1XFY5_CAEEL|nr:Peptidase M23 [Caenorhabditis elegans]CCD73384.1 Peptidase M23 [Caenorhabditis elegans]|eukprot:NP_001040695.1 Uncharacterized protein CELE_W03D8.11 [Caenorhabditis elegans]
MRFRLFLPSFLVVFTFAGVVDRRKTGNDADDLKFAFGTIEHGQNYGARPFLQIPVDGEKLTVPKAFYHYSENEMSAGGSFGLPDETRLLDTDGKFVNNRKEINGIYLPLPNMEPINLHFVNQKVFEKGIDTRAHEESPESVLHRAKMICLTGSEFECERQLLKYHRAKSEALRRDRMPLHEQLMELGQLSSSAKIHDKEGNGMGVVVGMPGYDPLYIGANLGHDNDQHLNIRFSPPA